MCTLSVSNMIYHKFSHGATFYMLNGRNVNVMLEFMFFIIIKLLNVIHEMSLTRLFCHTISNLSFGFLHIGLIIKFVNLGQLM